MDWAGVPVELRVAKEEVEKRAAQYSSTTRRRHTRGYDRVGLCAAAVPDEVDSRRYQPCRDWPLFDRRGGQEFRGSHCFRHETPAELETRVKWEADMASVLRIVRERRRAEREAKRAGVDPKVPLVAYVRQPIDSATAEAYLVSVLRRICAVLGAFGWLEAPY